MTARDFPDIHAHVCSWKHCRYVASILLVWEEYIDETASDHETWRYVCHDHVAEALADAMEFSDDVRVSNAPLLS